MGSGKYSPSARDENQGVAVGEKGQKENEEWEVEGRKQGTSVNHSVTQKPPRK